MQVTEADLIRSIGCHEGGTDYVGLIEKDLDRRVPDARYTSVYLPNDPPTQKQKDDLWRHLTASIDAGWGVIMNWVAPPSNYPKGVKGSANPSYGGGTIYHYVAAMGYDNVGGRAVWIADSGFAPYGFWISFDQCCTLIPPKGYCYAAVPPAVAPPPVPPTQGGVVVPPEPRMNVVDPRTKTLITKNKYAPREMASPMWIGIHTSESRSRAVNLVHYCDGHQVSYHAIGDDKEIVRMVEDPDAPWAAVNANKYAYHYCFSSSFASWSRNNWLDDNPSDGYNEREALRLGARQVAYWIRLSETRDKRPIPAVWIGGRNQPPWGMNGVCGHADFAQWGGGHTDPGYAFPVNIFMADVVGFLTGKDPVPITPLPPVILPGTKPENYSDWLIYRGKPDNDANKIKAVQRRLKNAYAAYAGHLEVDGDYSWSDEMAIRDFQKRSGLVADGIVGSATAAALKPRL